ncbi:MAG TPA: hypothetical protein VE783_08885 [Candidatus Limnocylindrales bacterium]|nr:hypothetical protein [Candidatus Limnocylindrales bacterium]
MNRILDLIRRNQVPPAVMRTASKGALPLPATEMLEILVYLTQNPVFAQDARMTLAGWDLQSARETVQDPKAPPEVIGYYWSEQNRRPALMPYMIENPAISENMLIELAAACPREIINTLLASPRILSSPAVTEALATNPRLLPEDLKRLRGENASDASVDVASDSAARPEEVVAVEWQREHADEIAAEAGKSFELVGEEAAKPDSGEASPEASTSTESLAISAMALHNKAQAAAANEPERLTVLQRVARMNASERVKTAFIGGKEERAILIRDGAKVVQNAVLASPKLTDPEVESFAAQKNVNENVLREIARNRRFMKHYSVVRNLVLNPKTPLDVSMPLVKMLMVYDLKALQHSKNVSEGIRRLAFKYYKEKASSGGKTRD